MLQNLRQPTISRLLPRIDQIPGLTQYQEGYGDIGLVLEDVWVQLSQQVILSRPLEAVKTARAEPRVARIDMEESQQKL